MKTGGLRELHTGRPFLHRFHFPQTHSAAAGVGFARRFSHRTRSRSM